MAPGNRTFLEALEHSGPLGELLSERRAKPASRGEALAGGEAGHHSSLCLHSHIVFSPYKYQISLCLSFISILVITLDPSR